LRSRKLPSCATCLAVSFMFSFRSGRPHHSRRTPPNRVV
jgi:hypothetical protein